MTFVIWDNFGKGVNQYFRHLCLSYSHALDFLVGTSAVFLMQGDKQIGLGCFGFRRFGAAPRFNF